MIQIPLTPQQFAARQSQLTQAGVNITGDSGEVTHEGVTVSYRYDGVSMLLLEIKHKPMFVPSSVVESKIREWFAIA